MNFEMTTLRCFRKIHPDVKEQELTQEVKLTDGMGEVGKILSCTGQVILRNKQFRNGTIQLSGGVLGWVMYEQEVGGAPVCVDTWLPFQLRFDIGEAEEDGCVFAIPVLRDISARQVAGRKLMLRAEISVQLSAAVPEDIQVYTPGEVPQDINLLQETYPITTLQDCGDKIFAIDEVLTIPDGTPAPKKICSYCVIPTVTEQKIMGDKLLFRGNAYLQLIYTDSNGEMLGYDFDLPFSQYVQLEKEFSTASNSQVIPIVSNTELDLGEDNRLIWKMSILCQYALYDTQTLQIVKDAYSTSRNIEINQQPLMIPAVLSTERVTFKPEQSLNLGSARSIAATFVPEHPVVFTDADGFRIELGGRFSVLGYDGEERFRQVCNNWSHSHNIAADKSVKLETIISADGKTTVSNVVSELNCDSVLQLDITAYCAEGIPMIIGIEEGEPINRSADRPALIIRKAGEKTLWDIAKESGSSVSAIQEANGLLQEPSPDQMLLIPVV